MGTEAGTQSSSTSAQATDSYDQTLTNSIGGAQSLGFNNSGKNFTIGGKGGAAALSYGYNSNNPITTDINTTTTTTDYALGANSSASPSILPSATSGTSGQADSSSGSGFSWGEVLVYIIGGIALVFVLRLFGDKKA